VAGGTLPKDGSNHGSVPRGVANLARESPKYSFSVFWDLFDEGRGTVLCTYGCMIAVSIWFNKIGVRCASTSSFVSAIRYLPLPDDRQRSNDILTLSYLTALCSTATRNNGWSILPTVQQVHKRDKVLE
jgi:hypothetical protein